MGGSTQISVLRLPTEPMGCPMPNLVGILSVVWAPNPNKQTNKQTDRHLSFIYIYRLGNQGVGRQNSLNLNLKGGKLIILRNQGVGRQNSLSLNLKGGKIINFGNRVGRQKCVNFNLKSIVLIKLGKQGAGRCIF